MARTNLRACLLAAACFTAVPAAAQTDACQLSHDAALLGELVEDFRRDHGRAPESLEELVARGMLRYVPTGADGKPLRLTTGPDSLDITAADGRLPSRWACVAPRELELAGAWMVAAIGFVGFARTRRRGFLVLAALFLVAGIGLLVGQRVA